MTSENATTATRLQPIVLRFGCIVADPPWEYGKWGKASVNSSMVNGIDDPLNREKEIPYSTISVERIKAMPVRQLAAQDCDLYLWTTQKYLPDAFSVMDAWGFRYCQTLTWCKTPMGTGQGGLYCPTTEFLLLGRIGKMPQRERMNTTWWNIKRPHRKHSAKPEFFIDVIEAMSDGPRLELFARRKRLGWHVWGDQTFRDVDLTV